MQLCASSKPSSLSKSIPKVATSHLLKATSFAFPARRCQRRGAQKGVHIAMASKQELHSLPGVTTKPDPSTKDFIFQQTMFRIKDPKASLDFYTRVLGMKLLAKLDFPSMKFSLYFMGYEELENIPEGEKERAIWTLRQKACLELTHNYGTENDPEFKGYHNGNSDPQGFGHIGLSVPNVEEACQRFEELGVEFVKKPNDGSLKGVAFIKDPDGYWVEILNAESAASLAC